MPAAILGNENLWGRWLTCRGLATRWVAPIGHRRAGCQPAPHVFRTTAMTSGLWYRRWISEPDHLRQPPAEGYRDHLGKVIGSSTLAGSERLKRFLRVSFDKTVRGEPLKESILGVEVFDRPEGYDTKGDPIVRVEARRLRRKLDEYYA